MELPILTRCDALVLGGTTAAMVCALSLRQQGLEVLLAAPETHLYTGIFRTGDLRPVHVAAPWQELLFPAETLENGLLHPDRLKRHGETLLQARGVRLLYACQALGWNEDGAVMAHKSGVYAIPCRAVYDLRATPVSGDTYMLHHMHEGQLCLTPIPARAGDTPRQQYERYEAALDLLPPGDTLARGGTAATLAEGLPLQAMIDAGLYARPAAPDLPPWVEPLHALPTACDTAALPLPRPT